MEIPKITINVKENLDELDKILAEWCDLRSWEHEYYRECIMKAHKPYVIIELLKEYQELEYKKMNEPNKYKVAMIIRDLKKLESPIIPGQWAHPEMQNYYHSRPWTDWTVWDIEREYLEVLMCRGVTESSIAPSDEFTNMEIIVMRDHFKNIREEAIFELLLSSGMRVGELTLLNKKDLDMEECTVIVHGKGDKQRECFFSELAKYKIIKYLETRTDDSEALFVALNRKGSRLKISGVSRSLRELGDRSGVNQVHPHRFRRTFATKLLHKGVPIDSIQKLLGHSNIETTQLYASSNDEELEYNIKRYVN